MGSENGPVKVLHVTQSNERNQEVRTTANMTGNDVMKILMDTWEMSHESMRYFGLKALDPQMEREVFIKLEEKIWKYNYRSGSFFTVRFDVKFFVRNIDILGSDFSRDIYYNCIRRLLVLGDIQFPVTKSPINLIARVLQNEFGDFDELKHSGKYFDIHSILESGDAQRVLAKYPNFESAAAKKFHSMLQSTSRRTALVDFFRYVMRLPTYGILWHPVDTSKGNFLLGIKSSGMVYYSIEDGIRTPVKNMNWKSVQYIKPDGKKFVVGLKKSKKVSFMLRTSAEAKYIFDIFKDSAEAYKDIYRVQKKFEKEKMEAQEEGDAPDVAPSSLIPTEAPSSQAFDSKSGADLQALLEKINDGYMNNVPSTEFDILGEFQQTLQKTSNVSLCNKPLNRYGNILAYDETRVKIPVVTLEDNDPHGYVNEDGYINANHVKLASDPVERYYICCQGPKDPKQNEPGTLRCFWTMIDTWNVKLIVMTTNLVEAGTRVKCAKYWPDMRASSHFGPLVVTCTGETEYKHFTLRRFELSNTTKKTNRELVHIQYTNWPDHGIPASAEDMIDFVRNIQMHRSNPEDITCVHCSAGIGRTGVTVMCDMMMSLLAKGAPVNILDLAKQLRLQRWGMIQMHDQYEFLYNCLELMVEESLKSK